MDIYIYIYWEREREREREREKEIEYNVYSKKNGIMYMTYIEIALVMSNKERIIHYNMHSLLISVLWHFNCNRLSKDIYDIDFEKQPDSSII